MSTLGSIVDDSISILSKPKVFFSAISINPRGIKHSLIKTLCYGTVAALLAVVYSYVFGAGTLQPSQFNPLALAFICLICLTLTIILLSSVCKGNNGLDAALQVASSLIIMYPIVIILSFLNWSTPSAQFAATLACWLYTVYLLYLGLTVGLDGQKVRASIVSIIIAILITVGSFITTALEVTLF